MISLWEGRKKKFWRRKYWLPVFSLEPYTTTLTFNDPMKKPFENTVGKGENAGDQHFLLFPQCFLPFSETKFNFCSHIYFVVCKCFQFGPV